MTAIPVIDAAQAARWDERARTEADIPSRVLMESAGRAVAEVMARVYADRLPEGVLLVAGHGNNGGDGWVAARALKAAGVRVWAVDEFRDRSDDCEANRVLALADGVERVELTGPWPEAGVTLDSLLGTGASGPPRDGIADLARRLKEREGPIVAIDGPTGLDLSTGEAHDPVAATLTVTFGGVRRGHLLGRRWCGHLVVVDIGFPAPEPDWPMLVHPGWVRSALPPLYPDMHKGDRGRLLILGGDRGMAGAAHYAAAAAFGAGAGLVKVAAHPGTVAALQTALPDALTVTTDLGRKLEPDVKEALEWADALILGPGLGRGDERTQFVGKVLDGTTKPAVIDADALQTGDALRKGTGTGRVLTPHVGEFRAAFPALADQLADDRFAATVEASRSAGGTVLVKGVPTVVAAQGTGTRVIAVGNPGLATGGSGDLLSGFIGAFLARGLPGLDAAALGAFVLGRAAELAAARRTARSMRPADVIESLPDLWRELAAGTTPDPPAILELDAPAVV